MKIFIVNTEKNKTLFFKKSGRNVLLMTGCKVNSGKCSKCIYRNLHHIMYMKIAYLNNYISKIKFNLYNR